MLFTSSHRCSQQIHAPHQLLLSYWTSSSTRRQTGAVRTGASTSGLHSGRPSDLHAQDIQSSHGTFRTFLCNLHGWGPIPGAQTPPVLLCFVPGSTRLSTTDNKVLLGGGKGCPDLYGPARFERAVLAPLAEDGPSGYQ